MSIRRDQSVRFKGCRASMRTHNMQTGEVEVVSTARTVPLLLLNGNPLTRSAECRSLSLV